MLEELMMVPYEQHMGANFIPYEVIERAIETRPPVVKTPVDGVSVLKQGEANGVYPVQPE